MVKSTANNNTVPLLMHLLSFEQRNKHINTHTNTHTHTHTHTHFLHLLDFMYKFLYLIISGRRHMMLNVVFFVCYVLKPPVMRILN